MRGLTNRMVAWWQMASTRARWVAGIVAFGLVCSAGLVLADGGGPANNLEPTPLYMLGTFLKLIFVLGLLIGGSVMVRNWAGRPAGRGQVRQINIVETTRISPRQSLHLIRVGGKTLLVGATDQSFSLISDLGDYEPTAVQEQAGLPAAHAVSSSLAGGPGAAFQPVSFEAVLAALGVKGK